MHKMAGTEEKIKLYRFYERISEAPQDGFHLPRYIFIHCTDGDCYKFYPAQAKIQNSANIWRMSGSAIKKYYVEMKPEC